MESARRSPRIYVEVPAEITRPEGDGRVASFLTHQLGKGGCMLKGGERITPCTIVIVTLILDGERIPAKSEIFYEYETDGMIMLGVRFLEVDPDAEKKLDEFIACRLEADQPEGCEVVDITARK
jgi:c-di-GMP-binding flagellar brake protein YcgR